MFTISGFKSIFFLRNYNKQSGTCKPRAYYNKWILSKEIDKKSNTFSERNKTIQYDRAKKTVPNTVGI
jgi:hypothetical protein